MATAICRRSARSSRCRPAPRPSTRPAAGGRCRCWKRRSAWSSTPSKNSSARSTPSSSTSSGNPLRADARRADHGAQVAVERLGQAGVEHQQAPQVVADLAAPRSASARAGGCLRGRSRSPPSCRCRPRRRRYRPGGRGCRRRRPACRRRTPAARSPSRAGGCRRPYRDRSAGTRPRARCRPLKSRRMARTAKPPPPVWIGMPSAWLIRVPRASAMKQREVVALAEDRRARGARHHPAHLVRDVVEPVLHQRQGDGIEGRRCSWRRPRRHATRKIVAFVDFEQVVRAARRRRGRALLDQQRAVEAAARAQVGAVVDRHVAPAVSPGRSRPCASRAAWAASVCGERAAGGVQSSAAACRRRAAP